MVNLDTANQMLVTTGIAMDAIIDIAKKNCDLEVDSGSDWAEVLAITKVIYRAIEFYFDNLMDEEDREKIFTAHEQFAKKAVKKYE